MTINEAKTIWFKKKRRTGCLNASKWFCKNVKGFYLKRLCLTDAHGNYFEHVVATNGKIDVDLTPERKSAD